MTAIVIPVIPKNDPTSGNAPSTTAVATGELAVNLRDGTMYLCYLPDGVTKTVKLLAGGASSSYNPASVAITGGTIDGVTIGGTAFVSGISTNGLTIGQPTASGYISAVIDGAAGSQRYFQLQTAASNRWQLGAASNSESGSNAGSDFFIYAYTDSGAYSSTPLTIVRSSGQVQMGNAQIGSATFTNSPTFNGGIQAANIGSITPFNGSFTNLTANTTTSLSGPVTISGATTFSSSINVSLLTANTIMMLNASKALTSAVLSNGLTAGSNTLTITPANINPGITTQTAAFTLTAAMNNVPIMFNSTTTAAVTVPVLTAGQTFTIIQIGTAKITWTASSTTINCSTSGATGTRAQYSRITFLYTATNVVNVSGDPA